jgi:hypothetical protein
MTARRSSPLPVRERIEGEGPYTARVVLRAIQDSASAPKAHRGLQSSLKDGANLFAFDLVVTRTFFHCRRD